MKIAIISGKGGSGKSSITAALVAMSNDIVAIDCDVDASNLPLLFNHTQVSEERFASGSALVVNQDLCIGCGICVDRCAFGALKTGDNGKVEQIDYMCEGCGLCERSCPQQALKLIPENRSYIRVSSFGHGVMVHGDLHPGDDNSGKMIARMREVADEEMKKAGANLQILDGPPGIGCPVLSTITGMDCIIIVCEPTLSGISDLKRAYKVASSYCKDVNIIVNKSDINATNRATILQYCQEKGINIMGELPFDKRIVEAQIHLQSIVSYAPDSECATTLKDIYQQIEHKRISELTE